MLHLHNGMLHSRKKEGLLPFATAWMELESIVLSEISRMGKDKYHFHFNLKKKLGEEMQTPKVKHLL